MKISTGTATQYQDIDSGQTLQGVPWKITDDADTVLVEATQSFPLDATADDVRAFLTQTLQVYKDDTARNAEASVLQASLDNASQVAVEISNISIDE